MENRPRSFPQPASTRSADSSLGGSAAPLGTHRGLHLVKDRPRENARAARARPTPASVAQTQAIVRQVEKEVAAAAARRALTYRQPAASPAETPRDTPWQVLRRVVHALLPGFRNRPHAQLRAIPPSRDTLTPFGSWPSPLVRRDPQQDAADTTSHAAEPAHV